MRIVLFPNSYPPNQLGGLEIAVKKLAEHLATQGCTVTVVTSSLGWWPSKQLESEDIAVHRVPLGLPNIVIRHGFRRLVESLVNTILSLFSAPLTLIYVIWVIRASKPDVVNLHYIGENAAFCLALKRLLSFRLVVNIHGSDIHSHNHHLAPLRWVTRRTLEVGDSLLSNSADLLRKAEAICPNVKNKSEVVGNGVDLEEFVCSPPARSAERYVLCVARLEFKKGIDVLVEAFKTVRQSIPDVELLIAGDGPEGGRCAALVEELRLEGTVKLLGKVEPGQIPHLLAGCEVFVLPSRQEGFGITILEAMASRKAVIATRVGGVTEIISHMKNGLLVEPESPDELAKAIVLLLQDTELRNRLAKAGYETVRTRFTWDRVIEKYLDVYEQVTRSR